MIQFTKAAFLAFLTLPFLTTAITTSPPAPTFRPPPSTCPGTPLSCQPSPFTTIFVTSGKALITKTITTVETQNFASTVTLPTVVSLPHSCFTYLIPTPQSNNAFCGPFTLNCGPSKQCTVTSTTTGACKDPCCTCTPVVPTLGGCKTACEPCTTTWKTVARTQGCSA